MTLRSNILTVVIGVVVGAVCALAMWWVGEAVGARAAKLQARSQQRFLIRTIYASSILWILLAAMLGRWASIAVLRLP